MAKGNTRARACKILLQVIHGGQAFTPSMVAAAMPTVAPRDRAFIVHLCFGVLRFYFTLEDYLTTLLPRPLKAKDADVRLLILIGLYHLFYTDTPAYAALNETVQATQYLRKSWARGLVNGILRQALIARDTLTLPTHTSHPVWLRDMLRTAWPEDWERILAANQTHPPFALRVNTRKISVDDYIALLQQKDFRVTRLSHCPEGIIITPLVGVEALPGFSDGLVSVQDGASQRVAALLALAPSHRVLDACAAPGGKTAHILEKTACSVYALEKDTARVARLQETLTRLSLSATIHCVDAGDTPTWWDGQLFDRILLDAPCSATGIIRRHPDIKNHRKYEDIASLSIQQARLLNNLWPLLKPDGILLYSTCSIMPQENTLQIADFLEKHSDACEYPITASWGIALSHGRQLLPGDDNMDGFYYARLRKVPKI